MPATAPFSFELFPPRNEAVAARMPEILDRLAAAGPAFMSVTYGAGGSSRRESLEVLRLLMQRHPEVDAMAHLSCVGLTADEAGRIIRDFLDAGVRRFLAVRGDLPADAADATPAPGELQRAAELVQLIDRIQKERAPYREHTMPGQAAVSFDAEVRERVTIAVAAFPNGHAESHGFGQDIDALLAKQAAGANLAITQLFFHVEDYFAFVRAARAAGVELPILPGLMPVTSPARLRRMLEISGEDEPSGLAIRLEVEPGEEGRREIGIEHAAEMARRLIEGGAPGIHLYTYNQPETSLAVLERAGLLAARVTASAVRPLSV